MTTVARRWRPTWTLTGDGAGSNDVSGTTPVDSGTGLLADTFALSESGGPSGYSSGTGYSCVGGTQVGQSVTVGIGQSATCTITNNDIPPQLHLRKVVVNDNGGTALATASTLTGDGAGSNDVSGTTPVDSGTGLLADTFALSETRPVWLLVGDRLLLCGWHPGRAVGDGRDRPVGDLHDHQQRRGWASQAGQGGRE